MLPGLHSTCPRSTSVRSTPRNRHPDVVPGHPFVQRLLEHLHPGHDHLALLTKAHDLDLFADLDHPALDPARSPPCPAP